MLECKPSEVFLFSGKLFFAMIHGYEDCQEVLGNPSEGVTRDLQFEKNITRVLSCSFDKPSWLLTTKFKQCLYIQLSVGVCAQHYNTILACLSS